MSKVYIALQDNEASRYIIEAIEQDNPDVVIIYQPAMIRIEREARLRINRETVEEMMGCEWEIPAIHVNLITLGGNVEEDEDSLTLSWKE